MADLICPECGAMMILRETRKFTHKDGSPRKFYGCSRWPNCKGIHGAHPNGEPLGIPADKETKQWRMKAHDAFDGLWKKGNMTRNEAYDYLAGRMALSADDCHIGRFDKNQCMEAIKICEKY
jgi:ssDNA-binding Zn-finger/Zn-ribbon topoisomerase 1